MTGSLNQLSVSAYTPKAAASVVRHRGREGPFATKVHRSKMTAIQSPRRRARSN